VKAFENLLEVRCFVVCAFVCVRACACVCAQYIKDKSIIIVRLFLRIRSNTGQLHLGVRSFNIIPKALFYARFFYAFFALTFNALANCVHVLHLRSVVSALTSRCLRFLRYPCISDWNAIF
jgi:hypothetical protein